MPKLQLLIVLVGAALLCVAAAEEDEGKKNLNPSDFFEPCATPFVTKNHKTDWASGAGYDENSTLYLPFWNKAMVYYTLQRVYNTQEFDDIKESHLTNNCITHKGDVKGGETAVIFGPGERNFSSTWIPVPSSPGRWYWPPHFPGATPANVYRTFTDNKLYTLFTVCWENGMGTYFVSSFEKTLPPETLNTIKEVVLALGFKEEFFVESNSEVDCETLEDLPVPKNVTTPPVPTIPNFLVPNLLFHPQTYPQQNFPQQNLPQQNYPQQAIPQQNFPQQNFLQQSFPQKNFPQQNYPPQHPSLYRLSYSWRK